MDSQCLCEISVILPILRPEPAAGKKFSGGALAARRKVNPEVARQDKEKWRKIHKAMRLRPDRFGLAINESPCSCGNGKNTRSSGVHFQKDRFLQFNQSRRRQLRRRCPLRPSNCKQSAMQMMNVW